MTLAATALTRLVAVGLAYVSGSALNAALHASTGLTAAGYALFALSFLLLGVLTWKSR